LKLSQYHTKWSLGFYQPYAETGSSPNDRLRRILTKDDEMGRICVPLFALIVGSNLSGPTKNLF
jgi:hypothetical protein